MPDSAMKKVLIVFGTRPEAIKMAPIVQELRACDDFFSVVCCATGQHREMLDPMLQLFAISPDYDLNVMSSDQELADLTNKIILGLDTVLKQERPDLVLVQGDTTTAFAGALVAYYHKVPVGHVEAGLRSFDRYQPFPEELNRRLADTLSTILFAPTERALQNLRSEGCIHNAHVTGNTVIDALLATLAKPCTIPLNLDPHRRLILVTAHRRENFGEPLENICTALHQVSQLYPSVEIVFPVHYNPNCRTIVHRRLDKSPHVHLVEPLGYHEFVHLMARSYLILTDSGGIQEEAPSLDVPVLVLREVTERPEAVEAGATRVVGTDADKIVDAVGSLMDQAEHGRMSAAPNPYGDGRSANRIVGILRRYLETISTTFTGDPVAATRRQG